MLANKYLIALKRTILSSSYIISKEIDPEAMPPVPDDLKSWEEHFLQVCSTRLSLALAKEKEEFETDFLNHVKGSDLRLSVNSKGSTIY